MKLQDRVEGTASLVGFSQFIRRALESAEPIEVVQFGRPVGRFFYGSQTDIQWLMPMPAFASDGEGLWAARLLQDQKKLLIQFRSGTDRPAWNKDDLSYVLLEGVNEFSLAYRESPFSPWVQDWSDFKQNDANSVPEAVRITIKVKEKYWPEIIVPFGRVKS
ncbi:type II secretion system protein GspJ [Gilvimarinus xylanilyticus]|uniref:Uncharacterized protein n=1 Tax=Gilvimarinus xylanilyticus TaxID=2944139 RepID=A0A9X2I249_9GAMM|nr:type II secretion system protein GspJ [Gilvimarinus xylanilyticus]MCP8899363.1 hypothetical protein [Gilvimarinus xylanilyticus]